MSALASLQPRSLWAHFQTLCDIPRPSGHEAALRTHLIEWAESRGLETRTDTVGNLVIAKPATPGMENRETVVLQGHLDMVAQQNAGTGHDFERDPIRVIEAEEDGWIKADGTTLGADNGLGVAAALAILESDDIAHPAIEALFTIDEEAGMTGAHGLSADILTGRLLLNLDTEDWGEFYVGCAGGVDVRLTRQLAREMLPAGWTSGTISLTGLKGGHSGVDIHLERGNANKLMARILDDLLSVTALRLVSMTGGTLRNALPREAFAGIACSPESMPAVLDRLEFWQAQLNDELAGAETGIALVFAHTSSEDALDDVSTRQVIDILNALPNGVNRKSRQVSGVVETSDNVGVVTVSGQQLSVLMLVRSLRDSGMDALVAQIAAIGRLAGCRVETSGRYPGWTPDPASPLLQLGLEVYRRKFGQEAAVKVIHAGLECGLLGSRYPGMDMLSFGPTIRGAHSPDERVDVATVQQFWELLKAILSATPEQKA
ncbi:PepD [Laribacter hongkongensis HLHK9]|uniref:Cytosol non-specific dipeptidase n=1 Tax=Laribacter hongkongensis (strain HLHK9) TaxID=557598 RepID=C1D8D9_LARHH|nr:aminoacyl-histidine dipeptidase [Laribacter hongkongensis]ACO74729.1 PepD [Laribacter hongkongensis HLHK9]